MVVKAFISPALWTAYKEYVASIITVISPWLHVPMPTLSTIVIYAGNKA